MKLDELMGAALEEARRVTSIIHFNQDQVEIFHHNDITATCPIQGIVDASKIFRIDVNQDVLDQSNIIGLLGFEIQY